MLFLHVRSLGVGVLRGGEFATSSTPTQAVRLGLVITHFNREARVVPAVHRIAREVLALEGLRGAVTLTVVDNSRNLPAFDLEGVSVLPNENLGGSGGFTRGLLSLRDSGRHTHCLFMDDDASCEAESIVRAYWLLAFSRAADLAVAGSLLHELEPWRLWEKGARFDGVIRPLHVGLNMIEVHDLLVAESGQERPQYGAWWFFAFPIAEVKRFPFPFFVRGDDVLFGLSNNFSIQTMNGVGCFGDDFGYKHGALTTYLDARYHILYALAFAKRPLRSIWRFSKAALMRTLYSHNYGSAKAFNLAVRQLSTGVGVFESNLDMSSIRKLVNSWAANERLTPMEVLPADLRQPKRRTESPLRRAIRQLTLNGMLLPDFLLKNRTVVQPKGFYADMSAVFRYRRILYEHAPSRSGYVVERSRWAFVREVTAFLRLFLRIALKGEPLRRECRLGFERLASESYWRSVYVETKPVASAMATAPTHAPQHATP